MNILVVDDEVLFTKSMRYFLEKYGFRVDVVNSASDFDVKLLSNYDVVVLDLMLRSPEDVTIPKGLETGEWIYEKLKGKCPEKKVVVVTGVTDPKLKARFSKDGTVMLNKPIDSRFSKLIEAINGF